MSTNHQDGTLVLVLLTAFYYYIAKNLNWNVRDYNRYVYLVCAIVFIALIPFLFVKYSLRIEIDGKQCKIWKSYNVLKSIPIWKANTNISNIEALSLVRLSHISNYLEGRSIRRTLGIRNKYVVYIIGSDYNYDKVVGFDNYIEAKRTIEIIGEMGKYKMLDTTENEYKDEDDYIGSYIRYSKMVNEIKKESV